MGSDLGTAQPDILLEALPNPVFVKDERHRWVLLNEAFCRFIGHSRAELLGKSDHDFFPRHEADVFWRKDDLVFATGRVDENEEQFTDSAGRPHVILTRKTLATGADGRRFLVGVITDITERKQIEEELKRSRDELDGRVRERTAELQRLNEQLQEADRRKTEFLNALSHELRNPLAPIPEEARLWTEAVRIRCTAPRGRRSWSRPSAPRCPTSSSRRCRTRCS